MQKLKIGQTPKKQRLQFNLIYKENRKKVITNKMKREMKKSYLTLAAMAMIMASCSNEVLIDNEDGQTDVAIGFSTFSDKATKGDVDVNTNLEYYHGTFAVYGTKKSTVDNTISNVFDATKITYQNGATTPNDWTYSPYR